MKTLSTLLFLLITLSVFSQGTVYHKAYTKKDGTYVPGHYQSKPNSTVNDNWSHQGNTNPRTGSTGTATTHYPSSGQTIQTGPKGGQYYINSNGHKTYIRK